MCSLLLDGIIRICVKLASMTQGRLVAPFTMLPMWDYNEL